MSSEEPPVEYGRCRVQTKHHTFKLWIQGGGWNFPHPLFTQVIRQINSRWFGRVAAAAAAATATAAATPPSFAMKLLTNEILISAPAPHAQRETKAAVGSACRIGSSAAAPAGSRRWRKQPNAGR